MIEKWKAYCGGSRLLAWLTIAEAGMWLLVTILGLAGRLFHFNTGIDQWLTLPSHGGIFITRPWTILTYMMVHFDVLHMLFNVLWLYWFGRILLLTMSDRDLALYFIGGGVAGGILFMCAAAAGLGGGWLCGCSAAVIAVMCGAALRLPDHPVNLLLIGEVKLKWVALACCALTFLGGGGNQAAHVGGLLWGVGLALYKRHGSVPRRKVRKADKMVKALKNHQDDLRRLDELLDKIKKSGYGGLSRKEREELNDLSKRIKK